MSLGVEAALKGRSVLCGSPTYDQVRILWGYTKRAVGGVAKFNQGRLTAEFPNGGRILYRSLDDPSNVKGHSAHLVLLDEAPLLKPEAWYEAIMPMLFDSGGDAWLAGTPNGRNWYWVEHQLDGKDRTSWQIPTVGVAIENGRLIEAPNRYSNPHKTYAEMLSFYEKTPQATFRQEYLAEFIEDNAQVFRNIRACIVGKPEKQVGPYVVGVDLARTIDFSVFTVLNTRTKQVEYIDRFNNIDYVTQQSRLMLLNEKYRPELILIESNSVGAPFLDQLERAGLPVEGFLTTNASKKNIIDALALAFERKEIGIPDEKGLINELLAFEGQKLPSGKIRYAAPKGMHDDYVISLGIAWEALMREEGSRLEFETNEFLSHWRG